MHVQRCEQAQRQTKTSLERVCERLGEAQAEELCIQSKVEFMQKEYGLAGTRVIGCATRLTRPGKSAVHHWRFRPPSSLIGVRVRSTRRLAL